MAAWPVAGLVLAVTAVTAVTAHAEELDALTVLDAPVAYVADYSLTANDQTWRGRVEHMPGRERRDFATVLGSQAILLRRDIDQAAVLWPERRWYLTTSLAALAGLVGGPDGLKIQRRHDGTEMIDGEPCTRWLVEGGFNGRLWFSADGILVRASGILVLEGHEKTVATQLAHVKRGQVDPDEFELPLGYRGIPVSPALFGKVD